MTAGSLAAELKAVLENYDELMDQELQEIFGLAGQVAVVTGAAGGIGRETAIILARAGADVVLADISEDGLARTAEEVAKASCRRTVTQVTDVSRKSEVDALAEVAVAEFGRIDTWANVAGILRKWLILDATEEEVSEIFAVNYFGTYWGVAAAGRIMTQAGRGSIINVASAGGELGSATSSGYGVTKASVLHLTKIAAAEFGPSGVRVNAVSPGWIVTPMTSYRWTDPSGHVSDSRRAEVIEAMSATVPLRMVGEPRDIALSILFLASSASKFVTGQTMRTNGGIVMV
jgi:3-oxoacyl-[acyl-carrier protein] reductase